MDEQRFANEQTRMVFYGLQVRHLPGDIQRRARMRLQRVLAARDPNDLRFPPSHRLERLRGRRDGQYSIRINDQWRVCFYWTEQGATEVEIVDYH